jgi:ribosomal-protein-alanine N-acetyltransferase
MTGSGGLPADATRIRPMQPEDIFRMMQIADSLTHAPHWPAQAYNSILSSTAVPQRLALVAEAPASSSVVGFVVASLVAGEAELESVAVAAKAQRSGHGGQLLNELVDSLRQLGVATLNLEVRASNHAAVNLYRRLGFLQTGQRPSYYADPVEDALLMSLNLR